eukprot:SAG31_NODE_583_length_13888_cov_18.838277_5_plen_74_part_00
MAIPKFRHLVEAYVHSCLPKFRIDSAVPFHETAGGENLRREWDSPLEIWILPGYRHNLVHWTSNTCTAAVLST